MPIEIVDLHIVKFVFGQDNFHMFFPVDYRKGGRNETWAVKRELGWTLSEPLPKHEIAQFWTTFWASDQNQLADQL